MMVEEKVFIPSTESYEFLKEDLGTLTYVNKNNQLFLLFAQKLYQVDIETGTSEVLEEGIKQNHFVVSDTKAHAAWLITSGDDQGKIREIEFDSLKTRDLSPENGQKLRVLGFMNEDLVYGILSDADILTDANGHETEGLSTFRIESFKGKVKKEYHQDGLYITNVTVVEKAMEAIRNGACIVTDTQMAKAGINKRALARYGGEAYCFMSDEDVAALAKKNGTTRATASME